MRNEPNAPGNSNRDPSVGRIAPDDYRWAPPAGQRGLETQKSTQPLRASSVLDVAFTATGVGSGVGTWTVAAVARNLRWSTLLGEGSAAARLRYWPSRRIALRMNCNC